MIRRKAAPKPNVQSLHRLVIIGDVQIVVSMQPALRKSARPSSHLLHSKCQRRIKRPSICPEHGELSSQDLVAGFPLDTGEYVVMAHRELRPPDTSTSDIDVRQFIHPTYIIPPMLDSHSFVLPRDGLNPSRYVMFWRELRSANRFGLAHMKLRGYERIAVLQPLDDVFLLSTLHPMVQLDLPPPLSPLTTADPDCARRLHEFITTHSAPLDYSTLRDKWADELRQKIAELREQSSRATGPTSASVSTPATSRTTQVNDLQFAVETNEAIKKLLDFIHT